jgi:hypothetical protein
MELNNMDTYKERYEAALKRAQDFENGIVHFALKPGESIVHWIFPELAESEDERIRRKQLITMAGIFRESSSGCLCRKYQMKNERARQDIP